VELGETNVAQTLLSVPGSTWKTVTQRHPTAEELDGLGEENFATLVAVLINSFDGAAIAGHVLKHPDIEGRRIPLVTSLLNTARSRGLLTDF